MNSETKWDRLANGDVLLTIMHPVEAGKDAVSQELLRVQFPAAEWPHVVAAVGSSRIPEELRLRAALGLHAGQLVVFAQGVTAVVAGRDPNACRNCDGTGLVGGTTCFVCQGTRIRGLRGGGIRREMDPAVSAKVEAVLDSNHPRFTMSPDDWAEGAERMRTGGIQDAALVHVPTRCKTGEDGRWRCAEECPVLAAALLAETQTTCGLAQLRLDGPADVCTFAPEHVGRHSWEAPEQELPL